MTKSIACVMILLLSAIMCSGAPIDLTQWQYLADVTVEDSSAEYSSLILTPEVYNVAKTDLADLRLINRDGNQIPYVSARDEDRTETVRYSPKILNRSTDAAGNVFVTLDFGEQTIKNCLEVETTGDSFRRAVKAEGSNDNTKFFTIVERAYVFAVGDGSPHRFSKIDLPDNDYRYVRITVSPMASEESKLNINEVRAFRVVKKPAQKQTVEMTQTEYKEAPNTRSSSYVYDLKFRRLPVVEIELNVKDNSFDRCVSVLGRDAATKQVKIDSEDNRQRFTEVEVPWNTVTTATIYRYTDAAGQKHERLTLPVYSGGFYRYLKVVVSNYDDQPITIHSASAKMIPYKIIFPTTARGELVESADKSAKLYVGCESAGRPQYDLARLLTNPAQVKTTPAKLAALADNPLTGKPQQKLPWTEQHKKLLLAILLAVVVVVGVFMLKSLKTIQKQKDPD